MAQPVFEEHPLEEYFRSTGENVDEMPGALEYPDLLDEPALSPARLRLLERMPSSLATVLSRLQEAIYSSACPQADTFAERFKYDVISSSLLATSIAAPASATRRAFSPDLAEVSQHATETPPASPPKPDAALPATNEFPQSALVLSFAAVALSAEYYFVCISLVCYATLLWQSSKTSTRKAELTSVNLDAINDLISAGNVWDSTVNEAITLIEGEERSIFYGPTSPQSPSSALRVALQSSLHTTQTQCDNVRQLLSALTDPAQLSQMSEMYAPSSPLSTSFSLDDNRRPLSAPAWRQRTISTPANKRATWNGSYAALAVAGTPTPPSKRRRSARGHDLSDLFASAPLLLQSSSAPATPDITEVLPGVREEEDEDDVPEHLFSLSLPGSEHFGAAALDLRRKRRTAGMETIGIPPPYSSQPHLAHTPASPSTAASGSRLTALHTTRHPLSLSGLHLALHGALSAKRYACSHLLALRFDEEEDESYWEDVRSVMALLTSTFEDASSRLVEALDEAEKKRKRDERPTPPGMSSRDASPSPIVRAPQKATSHRRARTMSEMVSFAPMPSHLSRFAAHVDAISTALNDARDHLEQCVSVLRERALSENQEHISLPSVQDHPAFQAYDQLRKELGFALRECERGRERLLELVSPPAPPEEDLYPSEDTPALGQDNGSEQSDKHVPGSPANSHPDVVSISSTAERLGLALTRDDDDEDDVTKHLLITSSSKHLPPPGIEQVFEADSGPVGVFTRERSQLSREERIRLAKARRENRGLLSVSSDEMASSIAPSYERWGPGGEVVQELKDVIWKVSEKKRRMGTHERPATPLESEQSMEPLSQDFYTPRTYQQPHLEESPTS